MKQCDLCGQQCHIDRLSSTRGTVCRTGEKARIYSYGPHFGEEWPLVGEHGSGTIFFSRCNLRCVFCQNWMISQQGNGWYVDAEELADIMLELQHEGCLNINLVSPSHVVGPILEALPIAAERGLRLPLVYNTGGYDSVEVLELLDGVIDIYMPDMKFGNSQVARRYLGVCDYAAVNRRAVQKMHSQVGDLILSDHGIALRGLIVRHLVLPGGISGTEEVLNFLARNISTNTYLNLMSQYRPCYRADEFPPLGRQVESSEFRAARTMAKKLGLLRLDNS